MSLVKNIVHNTAVREPWLLSESIAVVFVIASVMSMFAKDMMPFTWLTLVLGMMSMNQGNMIKAFFSFYADHAMTTNNYTTDPFAKKVRNEVFMTWAGLVVYGSVWAFILPILGWSEWIMLHVVLMAMFVATWGADNALKGKHKEMLKSSLASHDEIDLSDSEINKLWLKEKCSAKFSDFFLIISVSSLLCVPVLLFKNSQDIGYFFTDLAEAPSYFHALYHGGEFDSTVNAFINMVTVLKALAQQTLYSVLLPLATWFL